MRLGSRATLGLAALLMFVACGGPPPTRGVVLISLDTTRADRLGCYGYEDAHTPNLDAFAEEAVRFGQALSPVPVTLPAHATMFTGLYPPRHGIRYNGMFQLEEASVTVAELLRDAGWTTAGVPSAFPLSERTGIAQGFDRYEDMFRNALGTGAEEGLRVDGERPADEVSRIGIEFLQESGAKPFFLWLHYWEPHYPYFPPFPYSSSFRDRPYDGEIAYMDQELGRLFDALREMGLWDETLVIVVGDHGEGLYDHGEKMHANLVYQSTLHVPLIVKAPGGRTGVVDEPVSLVDLAPTILDFTRVEGPPMEGLSLRPVIVDGDPAPRRELYFETLAGSLVYGWSPLEGLRRGPWKYVRGSSPELFDLGEDPDETQNLEDVYGDVVSELGAALDERMTVWQATASSAETATTPVDQASLELLASLGYLGGFMTEERSEGPDPRDLVHLEMEIFAARDEMGTNRAGAAEARLARLLEADPTNRLGLMMAAKAASRQGEVARALDYSLRAIELYPEYSPARILHGEMRVARGEIAEAAEVFRGGLEFSPDDEGLSYRLAVALYALERVDESQEITDRMIARGGAEVASFLVLRGACRASAGDPEAALEALRAAIAAGYRDREILEEEALLAPLRKVPGFAEAVGTIPAPPAPKGESSG